LKTVSAVNPQVSKSLDLDVTLETGGSAEQVTVAAGGEIQLQKEDASIGVVIDRDRIARLPNASRQATDLLNLQSAVTTGGWYLSGIFGTESGQPLQVTQNFSGQTFGGTVIFGYGTGAIPTARVSTGNHTGVAGSNQIGTNANGRNLFSNPEQAFKSLRPALLSEDGRTGRGVLRGLSKWQLDLSLGKQTKIAERVSFGLSFDFFNIFNHPNFYDPGLNLEDPTNFGVITTQITPNPDGFPLAQTFYRPRAIQIGARIQF
jgi:hypothetical protein